ncbi:hypothetical protein CY34DRAFT_653815 [Suillus luteus UH-Slu-Lm8-n1]|uniref:Unplaced genomic scaffold CY34scaffold_66, whole genome shotgun sequence n=1 Tax=Suillus luteus UH-Slu-Lm8-n1 TaxID=930992 RepID=A0A0D0BCV9_9AGAM|nr:hypothetical protein CY34DRAFT_653815 [Suillus luteus UH-Slu-Lm8-n1]
MLCSRNGKRSLLGSQNSTLPPSHKWFSDSLGNTVRDPYHFTISLLHHTTPIQPNYGTSKLIRPLQYHFIVVANCKTQAVDRSSFCTEHMLI